MFGKGIYLSILVLTLCLQGCGRDESDMSRAGEPVSIALTKSDISSVVYLAKERGYFKDQGLDVTLVEYPSGKQALKALLAGRSDFATASEFALVGNVSSHPDLRAVATVSIYKNKAVIARKDRGIDSPSDLKGKRVGFPFKTGAEIYFSNFLLMNGIKPGGISLVDIPADRLRHAMLDGEIDACSIWDPYAYEIQKSLGTKGKRLVLKTDQVYFFLMLAKNGWLRANPALAQKAVQALVDAETYAGIRPGEMKQFVKEYFAYDHDYMDYILPRIVFAVSLPQRMLPVMEAGARWRMINPQGKEAPNFLDYIHFNALEQIKPAAVTIIH